MLNFLAIHKNIESTRQGGTLTVPEGQTVDSNLSCFLYTEGCEKAQRLDIRQITVIRSNGFRISIPILGLEGNLKANPCLPPALSLDSAETLLLAALMLRSVKVESDCELLPGLKDDFFQDIIRDHSGQATTELRWPSPGSEEHGTAVIQLLYPKAEEPRKTAYFLQPSILCISKDRALALSKLFTQLTEAKC